ncbi:conserved Plasmodium protein, unknown function [Plasmodium knowlesi strain H]|uniref:Seipin domain-containing protein n=3 Tax=Plasmodium knowlesi TaxID=5850 RepID=A0A5K1TW73_PLAKH|nr:seipin domain-containing protein, putative [Plasmodium knowlesi strain H]OTN66423.1 Uncharacterized protein PKNOH_S09520600 [Plasmodium knowlesi]CAA9986374.1 seipin domain-containing protein, putative [Plasmodium knowlesi strain H]SBO25638.1 conserved Plasmodium protein, unknown function [Plasmodium knowlesi strain H]SBO28360.1 conserved Plasmodium protein, unknown function [Plasmodium knowlesi strain H]VVS75848.1 seipin domain-containing protein, putative [Plasmodium knowlesi strain H]|eukprot:XP_002257780.1 hypothetical protein, conserved in Plasmodium species [Plasmodium knowlesi strain H]
MLNRGLDAAHPVGGREEEQANNVNSVENRDEENEDENNDGENKVQNCDEVKKENSKSEDSATEMDELCSVAKARARPGGRLRDVKLFCKMKKKYLYLKRMNYLSYTYQRMKRKNRKHGEGPSNTTWKGINRLANCGYKTYAKVKAHLRSAFPNVNVKHCLYVLAMYLLINVAMFVLSLLLYFFLYFYLIPQNKYVYPVELSLSKSPIDEYLRRERCEHAGGCNSVDHNEDSTVERATFNQKNTMGEPHETYLQHLKSLQSEILSSIKRKDTCCCQNRWKNTTMDKYPFFGKGENNPKRGEKMHHFDNEMEYAYLQNNILTGQVNFQKWGGKNNWHNDHNIFHFFIPFLKKKEISKLKIKEGYKVDILLNLSYMNNDYNDKLNFIQLQTEVLDTNGDILFRNEKLHINNRNYDFINKLHLFFNTPFYFFNVLNRRKMEICLVDGYQYGPHFGKINIYLYPPMQIYEAYIVVLVYVNFVYYYMYNYPFLFFYVFVFVLSALLIFVNTILFVLGVLCYYLFG